MVKLVAVGSQQSPDLLLLVQHLLILDAHPRSALCRNSQLVALLQHTSNNSDTDIHRGVLSACYTDMRTKGMGMDAGPSTAVVYLACPAKV